MAGRCNQMSVPGPFQTSGRVPVMSASPLLADIVSQTGHVRKVPDSDMGTFEIADNEKAARRRLFNSD
jgi:hypothetical protein